MSELIYGKLDSPEWRKLTPQQIDDVFKNMIEQKATGLHLIDPNVDGRVADVAARCRREGLDFILGYTDMRPGRSNRRRLRDSLKITRKLAIGRCRGSEGEWYGDCETGTRFAGQYLKASIEYGYEWVCPLTHNSLCQDIKLGGGSLKRMLSDTMCLVLCGYILAGYVYGDTLVPHQGWRDELRQQKITSLSGVDLNQRYGLTVESLKAHLVGMNALSGAGWQPGLDVGTRAYARELGFKGLVIGVPFDLKGTLDIPINSPATQYPRRCGDYSEGYGHENAVS